MIGREFISPTAFGQTPVLVVEDDGGCANAPQPIDPKHAEDWNAAGWAGVPFDGDDWLNTSSVVGLLRKQASDANKKSPGSGIGLNRMADQLAVTRKKIQARVAKGPLG